ncbi:MAG: FAD synthase [Candidatus Diapherotrites archaeon CG11_big_fil_rev_8_21_14_0_20_37_9]|nr:MAG: FAD synthase [Candidatus Diapherotrites archaeon CG11_big_fil_rev_8_21_14_0_20_37_9]
MAKVLAFGTFDILHPGHLSYLKQAKALGNHLVVVVATDKNVERLKGKRPVNDQEHRKELVEALEIVDEAMVGFEDDMMKSIEVVRPDFVALGYDQKIPIENVEKELSKRGLKAEIKRMYPYNEAKYKSTIIKEKVKKIH